MLSVLEDEHDERVDLQGRQQGCQCQENAVHQHHDCPLVAELFPVVGEGGSEEVYNAADKEAEEQSLDCVEREGDPVVYQYSAFCAVWKQ